MGREVRRVPSDWQHPTEGESYPDGEPRYVPLFDGANYESDQASYAKYGEAQPDRRFYMPTWPPEVATHYMMYETCSEGTPISPAFPSPEELARWLFENGASAFGDCTASYEGWLRVARGRPSIGAVLGPDGWTSGVDAMKD